jgi:cell wall-associated NlpC family hydrolase
MYNITTVALSYLDCPFKHGATMEDARKGFFYDPTLAAHVIEECTGIELPVIAVDQAIDPRGEAITFDLENLRNLQPGDLLFSKGTKYLSRIVDGEEVCVGHVAIYVGGGMTVNSRRSRGGVILQSVPELHHDPSLQGIKIVKRFIK